MEAQDIVTIVMLSGLAQPRGNRHDYALRYVAERHVSRKFMAAWRRVVAESAWRRVVAELFAAWRFVASRAAVKRFLES